MSASARVVANVPLCREHFRLDVLLDRFPDTEPGQFIQLACRPPFRVDADQRESHSVEQDWSDGRWPVVTDPDLIKHEAVLRRPFSLADRIDRSDGVVLSVIHRVIGVGTDWLSRLGPGDEVEVLGPLGHPFPKPANGYAILVGGGVGIPPMLYLAKRWRSLRLIAFCGATTRDLLPLTIAQRAQSNQTPYDNVEPSSTVAEFAASGALSVISSDDGTVGYRGLVTAALENFLDRTADSAADSSLASQPVVYTCGPEGMMKRVAAIAAARGLRCFVAVERAMACGMGTCQSCVIQVRNLERSRYALSCTEGPVFDADDLAW